MAEQSRIPKFQDELINLLPKGSDDILKHLLQQKTACIYDSLFFTNCIECNKRIILNIPEKHKIYKIHNIHTCNECISENSPVRNGIDESYFTDISDNLWKYTNRRINIV